MQKLTERQAEIVDLVRQGMADKQIARQLGISVGVVRHHLSAVYDRLGVESRSQVIIKLGVKRDGDSN